jgi:hypothetical protein
VCHFVAKIEINGLSTVLDSAQVCYGRGGGGVATGCNAFAGCLQSLGRSTLPQDKLPLCTLLGMLFCSI